ncbi:MAG: N-acetyltransferase family protein [Treponema sp.]|nr:N-acetyltransferase family protein [Treponema sp.]
MRIRSAVLSDAQAILGIYAPYITDTCISFETEVPSIEEFGTRIEKIKLDYPYLVCESDGKVAGFAYASKHRERAAYRYSVDVSVYVAPAYQRQGIGSALYTELFEQLCGQSIYTVFAGIALPNDNSTALHKKFGFAQVGIYHNVGYKMGRWLDVMWMEKPLAVYNIPEVKSERFI